MLVVGVILVVGGLLGAGALWYMGGQRLDDNVAAFARAPSGCATTLDFERTGEFTLYVETSGRLDDLSGDCVAEADYDRDDLERADVVLADAGGAAIPTEPTEGTSYDTGTFVGRSFAVVTIDEPGDVVLTVSSTGEPFAVAVGGDPNNGVAALRWGAVVLAIVALVVGGVLLVVGSRRPEPAAEPGDNWQPDPNGGATWPIGPPGFPPPPPTTGASAPAGPPLLPPPGVHSVPGQPTLPGAPSMPASPPLAPPGWGPPSAP